MAIIKKFSPKENLNTFSTFVTDTNPNSDYFRITEFKETFTGGRNGFLIEGSEHLKETTEIKIEILDVDGNPLYFEPGDGIPEYYEGVSKLIAVYVYSDTPIGQAKITVLGELKTYLDGGVVRSIPDEWKGVYNVKWERSFKVNKLLPNEDRVRFYRRPKVSIEEIVKPIFNTTIPTVVQSGSINGIPNVPLQNQTLTNYTQPTSYRLEIVGDGAWTGSIIGTTLEFGGIQYSPTVVDIINSKNVIVNPPYTENNIVKSFTNKDYTASFQYVEGTTNGDSLLTGSFAKINITDLKTFVGDVARVKVFRKSKSNIGDFEFVQEIQLESNEVLVDLDVAGKNEELYGLFTDINIDGYWITSSNDITATFNQSYLYNSVKLDSSVGTQNFYTSKSLSLQEGVEYTLSFGVRTGLVSSPNYIQAFISGSRQSTLNGNPITIQVRKDIVKIDSTNSILQKQDVTQNFIAEKIDDAKLYFEVVGTDWYINNVSLKASQETAFSPDEITFIQSVPKTLQDETFDYKFEFYDINNNTIPVTVLQTKRFVGGNTALLNRSLDIRPSNLFFTFDSASQATGVQVINFEIVRNLLTGSVSFTSGAFDGSGTLIPSASYVGQYPGLLTNVSDTSATLTAANFTGSDANYTVQYITYTAFCEDVQTTETISRVSAGASGESGLSAGKFEATTEVFVKRFDDTFTPASSSITASFFQKGDVSNPISASLIVYPSHSFDLSDNDVNHLYYETGSIDSSIVLVVTDADGISFGSGKENARVTEIINLDFTFTDGDGASTNLNKTLNISTDGNLGQNAITVEVTPPNFVFIADESGNILNYDDLTTTISVYEGTTKLPLSISPVPGTYTGSTFTPTNITISDVSEGAEDITVGQFSNIVGDSANVVYNLVVYPIQTSIYKTESINTSFTQNLSVVKGGRNARSVNLSADTYIVVYDGDDNIVFPSSEEIQLQAQALNHTGSVYYQFLKNNVTQSQSELQSTYDLSSLDIVEAGETDVWSVVTRESQTGPIVAVDSISIAGVKSGKDSRSVSLVASSNFVNYDGTGSESPIGQEIVLTATPFNHTGTVLYEFKSGSTTIQSGSENTYIISASYTQSTAPNIPVKPLFNESHIYSVLTREGNLSEPILSADAITIAGIKAGTDSEDYAIVPLNGTAIKNSDPTTVLEIKATYQGQDLTSGDYKLAVLSASLYEPLSAASASGFIVGVNPGTFAGIDYNATFTSESISGSLTVYLVSGSAIGGIEDSITLADISDGLGGGFVEASTLTFIRDKNNTYTPTTSSVTASFYQRGTVTNPFTASLIVHPIFDGADKMKYVTASVSPFIEIQVDDQDGSLVQSGDESTTKDLNFIFKFVNPTDGQVTSVTETFFIVSDGIDGEDGLNAKVVRLSADSFVVSYDETGNTPTPSSILLIASSSNFLEGRFKFEGDGITEPSYTVGITDNTDTASFSVPSNYFSTPKTYRVGVAEGIGSEIASDTITIFAVKPGLPGTPGDSPIEYKIIPLSGSQIRNGEGTLELQLVQISGSVLTKVTSGDYKLASGSVSSSILSVGNGYTNGEYDVVYNPIISAEAISGSLTIYVITGSSGNEVIWDSITLTDVTDGLGGGSFLSSTLGMRRTASLNEFQPQFISVTASFFDVGQDGLEYTSSFDIFPSYSVVGGVDFMKFVTGVLHPSISLSFNDGDGVAMINNDFKATKDVVAVATFTSPKTGQTTTATETYYIISDGIDGSDAYTIVLTNESHTLPADSNGDVSSYVGSGTKIIAYKGVTKLSGSLSTPTAGFYSASVATQTGITANQPYTVDNNEIVYGDHSDMTAPSASIEYTIFLEGTSIQVPKLQSFSKSVAGATGAPGLNAKLLDISVSSTVFSFDNVGDTSATPLLITASIKQQNLSSAVLTSDISITGADASNITVPSLSGTITSGTGTQTFIISFADSGDGGLSGDKGKLPLTINVVKDGITERTTILKLEGGEDGQPGDDAYTISISNEAVTLPTTVAGVVSTSGSGTTINVLKGTTPLNAVSGTPSTGQFNVSVFSNSAHITPGSITHNSTTATIADITTWSDSSISSGSIVYAINAENIYTFYKTQSFALSYEGETGPGIVFRGFWTGSINYQYDIDSRRRDAVLYNSGSTGEGVITYYATLQPSGPSTTVVTPTGSVNSGQYWEELGVEEFFVAAKIAIFEESFVKNTINVGNNPGNDKANIIIQGSGSLPYIAIGQTGSVIGYEQPGIFMGVDVTDRDIQRFSIANNDNSNYLKWDGDNLKIKGNIEFGSTAPGQNIIQLDWKYKPDPNNFDSSAYSNIGFVYGAGNENAISYSLDPFGNRSLTWDCYSVDDATGGNAFEGGFNTDLFPIDSGSSYKYVVYVKPTNTNGYPLFGTIGYSNPSTSTGLLSGSLGSPQTNPYFRGFDEPIAIPNEQTGSWQVLIGYVHANSTPNTELTYGNFKGGAYSIETGKKLRELQDYKWNTDTTLSNLRIFHYSDVDTSGLQMQIWGPAVYKIDGTEPSDATLIDKAKAIADGKYSGGTFISADTIFSPTIAGIDGKFSGSVVVGHDGQGITLDGEDKKIYIGQGQYANQNTPFYVASGSTDVFSLGNRLSFNGSQLNVTGSIVATSGRISGSLVVGSTGQGITLDGTTNKMFIGCGIYNCENTSFYVASGSTTEVFSLGDKLTFNGTDLSINGNITADTGQIGGLIINSCGLSTSDAKLKIQSNPVEIEVKDVNDNTRFLTNTDTVLPNPLISDSGTRSTVACTCDISTSRPRTTIGDLSVCLTTKCTPFNSTIIPSNTGRYSIVWNYLGSGVGNNIQCVSAGGVDSLASISMDMVITCTNGCVVAGSSPHSVSVEGGEFQAGDIIRLVNQSLLSPRTFSISTNLISGSSYCLVIRENLTAYVLTPTDGQPFLDNTDVFACVSSTLDQSCNATYSGTNTYTIINGGGFQSVVGTGRFISICDSTSKPSTTIMGGTIVDALYQCNSTYDGIGFTNISSTTPSFNPIKAYVRFTNTINTPGTLSTICSAINVDCVVRGGEIGHYCVFFKCTMGTSTYGVIGTVEHNGPAGNARILNTICHGNNSVILVIRGDGGSATDGFCTTTATVLG